MKKVIHVVCVSAVAVALVACGGTTSSDPAAQTQVQAATSEGSGSADGRRPLRRPPGPPPEAFEACVAKAAGDACTVAVGDKTLTGKCVAPPPPPPEGSPAIPDGRLACRPDDLPAPPPESRRGGSGERPPGPPPVEVFAACDGKAAGDACVVTLADGAVDGTCRPPPGATETRLGCAPSRPPPK